MLPDGSVDYADDVLEQLDWVVASLHTSFRLSEKEQTERMLTAMEHPLVDVIGHPTGRLIERREAYALDLDAVIAKAVETGHLPRDQRESRQARPERRVRARGRRGGRDAHDRLRRPLAAHAANMRYGVATARRAWLTKEHVGNTRPWPELDKLRKRGRG